MPILATEIHLNEAIKVFQRFEKTIGKEHWIERSLRIEEEAKGNSFIKNHLLQENRIATTLSLISKNQNIPLNANTATLESIGFAQQTLSLIESCDEINRNLLIRRVHGGIINPEDMRALQLEISAATHFLKKGYSVEWPEMNGAGGFDLLVKKEKSTSIEIECKSISKDKGKKIHIKDARNFFSIAEKTLSPIIENLESILAVIITLNDRLEKSPEIHQAISNNILNAILANERESKKDNNIIQVISPEKDKISIMNKLKETPTRENIEKALGIKNTETIIFRCKNGDLLIIAIQSKEKEEIMKSIFKTIDKSAKKQLSKTRPALFITELHGLSKEDLIELANYDKDNKNPVSSLRKEVSNFLSKNSTNHVIGVSFLSKARIERTNSGFTQTAIPYTFTREDSVFWNPDFAEIF